MPAMKVARSRHGVRGIEVARGQGATVSTGNSMPFFSLILLQHSCGIAIDDLLQEAVRLFPEHLALRWLACKYALERGDGESVREDLEGLASINPDSVRDPELSYDKSLFSYASRDSLALCHFRAGRFSEAAEWYRRAAAAAPDARANEARAQLAAAKASARCALSAEARSPQLQQWHQRCDFAFLLRLRCFERVGLPFRCLLHRQLTRELPKRARRGLRLPWRSPRTAQGRRPVPQSPGRRCPPNCKCPGRLPGRSVPPRGWTLSPRGFYATVVAS